MSKIEEFKKRIKSVWDERYSRHIVRTVHQAGDDAETNIKLAELETDLFLFPEKEKCLKLYEDKTIRKCPPTFMKEFYLHQPISDYIGNLKDCYVLDYGCGSLARYSTALSKRFKKVLGVDSSPAALSYAKQFVENYDNISLYESNGVDLSGIGDNTYDFIFSNLVLQHVGDKDVLKNILKEFYRVLTKPGVARFSAWTEEKPEHHFSVYDGSGFSFDVYKQVLEEIGFQVETMTEEWPVLWVTVLKN